MTPRTGLVVCILSLLALSAHAQSPDPLTGGRRGKWKDLPGTNRDSANVSFVKDPGLATVADPRCGSSPDGATLRFSTSAQVNAPVNLPCATWRVLGSGFIYTDPAGTAGGVVKVIYGVGRLSIKAKGAGYAPPIVGPVSFADVRFDVGAAHACGRFSNFSKNGPAQVSAKGPTTACPVVCGDGIREGSEVCDDGDATDGDGCDHNCTPTGCGNGVVTAGEDCDDGNVMNGDGCRSDCTRELCGDDTLDAGEQCDDGNVIAGDCCSPTCQFETGSCDDGNRCTAGDTCVGSDCVGALVGPWVNEFDYDDFTGVLDDRDEFIEIAAPAGTNLGGYQILAVEGNLNGNPPPNGAPCLTDFAVAVATGNPYFTAVIPPGTVVGNDTGTGVGFVVACFANSSTNHLTAGECDVVLPAPATDSNLKNGYLLNTNPVDCPDGILLLDPLGGMVDALSYEGQVPNVGPYGPFFQTPSYSVGVDQGWVQGVSFEKRTSTLGRALGAAEWSLSGGCIVASPAEGPRVTTITSNVTAAATTIPIANSNPSSPFFPPFPSSATVRIDAELMTYSGLASNTLTGVTRGVAGTAPAPHASGAAVSLVTGCTPNSDSPGIVNLGQMLSCIPTCGNGTIDSAAGEACDPAAAPTGCGPGEHCLAAGQPNECTCQVLCGNGVVDAGEECDPPGNTDDCAAGLTCNADCTCPPAPACASVVDYRVAQSGLDLCTALGAPCGPPVPVTPTPPTTQTTFQLCFRAPDAAGRVGVTMPAESWVADAAFTTTPLALTQRFCQSVTASGTLFTTATSASYPGRRCLTGDPAKLLRSCSVASDCAGPPPTTDNGICASRDLDYASTTSSAGTVFGLGDGSADVPGALLMGHRLDVQIFLGGDYRCTGTGTDTECVGCDAVTPALSGRVGVIRTRAVAPTLVLPLVNLWSTAAVQNTVAQAGNVIDGRVVNGAGAIHDAFAGGTYEVAAANASLQVTTPIIPVDVQFLTKNLWEPLP